MTKLSVILLLLPLVVLLTGIAYQQIGLLRDHRRFPVRGRLIAASGTTLHAWEQGEGDPLVVLEAGIAGTCLGWAVVQPRIAQWTSVLSYDRAGLGWSYPTHKARTVQQMTSELRELLANSGHRPPYVLVGHSFGGLLVRAFAAHYPELTASLVLVDPVSTANWAACSARDQYRLQRGIALSRRGGLLARIGMVRLTLRLLVSGSRFLPKLIGRTAAGNGTAVMERLVGQVRRIPSELWPIIQSHWSDSKCFAAMAAYLEALPACAEEVHELHPPSSVPQIILSAETATQAELEERDQWAALSSAGKHIRVPETGHWIQLEQPNVVITAVGEAIAIASDSRLR